MEENFFRYSQEIPLRPLYLSLPRVIMGYERNERNERNERDKMKITRVSMFTGKVNTLDINVTESQLERWESGTLIQDAMPNLSPDEREFIMTGVTAQEWADEFEAGES